MPRYHNIDGARVQFTAEEETARDAEEAKNIAAIEALDKKIAFEKKIKDKQRAMAIAELIDESELPEDYK